MLLWLPWSLLVCDLYTGSLVTRFDKMQNKIANAAYSVIALSIFASVLREK